MPTNLEELQTLLKAWGDQLLVWLQSPAFLAQVGVIVAAIILAPMLARFIRKRVPLF